MSIQVLCLYLFLQLKNFKEDNLHVGFGSATLALEQAIEKTTANIKWVAENKANVLKWFTDESTWEHQNHTVYSTYIKISGICNV